MAWSSSSPSLKMHHIIRPKSYGIVLPTSLGQRFLLNFTPKMSNPKPNNALSKGIGWLEGFKSLKTNQLWRTQTGSGLRWVPQKTGIRAMFTGIVEEMGKVKELKTVNEVSIEMTIDANVVLQDVKLGDSIAVNGACLTVTRFDSHAFTVGLSPETLRKTSLGEVAPGSDVNLERALQPTSRMGGHFVQGHVDGTGEIVSMEAEGDSLWVKVRTSAALLKYIVPKGFITVDGTSLTVVDVSDVENSFNFMLVSYTQQKVVIPGKKVGNKVNLEVDILGKYVERLLSGYNSSVVSAK
eukprot:Gb_40885 [translate_table: standard]